MLDVNAARQSILESCHTLPAVELPLYEASGRVLAQDLVSPVFVPPFHQSAMDGYALCFNDHIPGKPLQVAGEVPAGAVWSQPLPPASALRIYTGAPLPAGCDTVVVQEKVNVNNKDLFILDEALKPGANVRPMGSQTNRGDLVASAGALLTPALSGFLAGLGFNSVRVTALPKVAIVSTGNELVQPGNALGEGQLYESNSYSLSAALHQLGIAPLGRWRCNDDAAQLQTTIQTLLPQCDVLILSGGVSVGDYDFVAGALAQCGVQQVFHKVKQKPGKPLYFGCKGRTLVFGLPGNPAAVLTCYYYYILPALKKLMGQAALHQNEMVLPIAASYSKKAGLTHFLKGKISGHAVLPLYGQESYLMHSFAEADCLIVLEESKEQVEPNTLVNVIRIH